MRKRAILVKSPRAFVFKKTPKITNFDELNRELESLTAAIGNAYKNIRNDILLNSIQSVTVNDDYIIKASDGYVGVVDVTAARTLTLPNTADENHIVRIKDEHGYSSINNITIVPSAGQTIDGELSAVIDTNYDSLILIYEGGDWFTI